MLGPRSFQGLSLSDTATERGGFKINLPTGEVRLFSGLTGGYFMTFQAGGNEVMRIPSAGVNILMGTTSDNGVDRLQVSGSVAAQEFKATNLNNAPASVSASAAAGEIRFVSGSTNYLYFAPAANTWVRTTFTTF
jgi:hypothetical protein